VEFTINGSYLIDKRTIFRQIKTNKGLPNQLDEFISLIDELSY